MSEQLEGPVADDFVNSVLDWKLGERLDAALTYIHSLPLAEVAAFDTDGLKKTLERFAIIPPRVRSDQQKRDDKTVELVDESFDRKTGTTGHCFFIPIDGEAEWLQELSAQSDPADRHPIGFIDKKQNWIYIKLSLSPDAPEGTLKRNLDRRVALIERYAAYVGKRVVQFNIDLAEKMTSAVNIRKTSFEKARKEIEQTGLPETRNPKHAEREIQIQRLMESLNSRYLRRTSYAEQLHADVRELIQKHETLDADTARLIIEKANDALKEFGSTNHAHKVELRDWKSRAESALAPKTFKQLGERIQAVLLRIAWRRPITKFAIIAFVSVIFAVSLILSIKKSMRADEPANSTESLNPSISVASPSAPLPSSLPAPSSSSTPSIADNSRQSAATSPPSQRICIHYEESKAAFDGRITIAVGAISFEETPLRHFVTFSLISSGRNSTKYTRKENGDKIIYRADKTFEIFVASIDAINACFDIHELR
jgi:hypothetical protein